MPCAQKPGTAHCPCYRPPFIIAFFKSIQKTRSGFAAGRKSANFLTASPRNALPEKAGKAGKGELLHGHDDTSKKYFNTVYMGRAGLSRGKAQNAGYFFGIA